jgi:hypothetical protein
LEEIFWVCFYSLEFLSKMAKLGEGFTPSLTQEKDILLRKLKDQKVARAPSISLTSSSVGGKKKTVSGSGGAEKEKSLEVLFARAKKQAEMETRLFAVEIKLKQRNNNPNSSTAVIALSSSLEQSSLTMGELAFEEIEDQEKKKNGNRENNRKSIVWHCPAKNLFLGGGTGKGKTPLLFSGASERSISSSSSVRSGKVHQEGETADNPLGSLPTKQENLEYTQKLKDEKKQKRLEEFALQQYLNDLQDSLLQKNKLQKQQQLSKLKEKFHEDLHSNEAYQDLLQQTKEKSSIQERLFKEREEQIAKHRNEREKLRINELKAVKKFQEEKAAEEARLQLEMEKFRISHLMNAKELQEIQRREVEEQRMRYLEEIQRKKEDRRALIEQRKEEAIQQEKARLTRTIQKSQARVRRGTFRWVAGQLQYYDNVRQDYEDDPEPIVPQFTSSVLGPTAQQQQELYAEKPNNHKPKRKNLFYLQYEDDEGYPYYFDPILKSYQKRKPEDAEIIHHVDYEREQYDALHGEGSYDARREEIAFKDSVNKHGGWYDERGGWVVARGYYDENYEWVDLDGYYDEEGKYVKYPKVQGDLSFMV